MTQKEKEIKITVPEGYEIDKENSTFECIKFKKKGLTYEDVAIKLFQDKKTYYLNSAADIDAFIPKCGAVNYESNATSEKQLQRLLAINKLMNVAEYLNEGWKPNWKDSTVSIGELLSVLPKSIKVKDCYFTLTISAEFDNWLVEYVDIAYGSQAYVRDVELIDALFAEIVILKEEGVI